ncbi:MAG: GGDEF domain-containing protein [Gammaproteobacteria bacterium]|nr:GGDEF domain-containing protein [Gammaproteobacteria bacterium]
MDRVIRFFKSKLSLQLFSKIILISGVLTLINISIQVYFDYKSEVKYRDKEIANVLAAIKVPLKSSLIKNEKGEVNLLLNELVKFESIGHVQIRAVNTNSIQKQTLKTSDSEALSESNLDSDNGNPVRVFAEAQGEVISGEITFHSGELTAGKIENLQISVVPILEANENDGVKQSLVAYSNFDAVKDKVLSNLVVIVITQGLKTFIVSLFLMALFYHLVIKHIHEVSLWLRSFSPGGSFHPITVSERDITKNELYELKGLVGNLGKEVHSHTIYLEQRVAERTKALAEANAKLEHIAYTDSLTAIANRLSFFNTAEIEIRRARRLSYHVGIALLDLDHFKQINDNYGHDAGDKVLVAVSDAMSKCLREQDCIGRIGGEEFAIILPGADENGLKSLTKRLRDSVKALRFEFMDSHPVTISIGFTVLGKNEQLNAALKRADGYLYEAKRSGRDCAITDLQHLRQIIA